MRRGLGKGLSQLLGEESDSSPSSLNVDSIRANTRQPRTVFEEEALKELADSIREFGVLQPLIVRPVSDGVYELIAGERRLRASKLAGLTEVPVIIRTASAQQSLEMAIVENVQREDISAVECAVAYQRLIEEFGLTQEQVAQRVQKSRVAISNTLRLLKLPAPILKAVEQGTLTEGHARALLMADSQIRMLSIFEKVQREGLSVREAERMARGGSAPRIPSGDPKPKKASVESDPNMEALERGLSEYFGTMVKIEPGQVGGKMVFEYYSDEDLTRILDILGFNL